MAITNNQNSFIMVIGKIKPSATIVAQFSAGVDIEVIQHDGKMFFPVVNMGKFTLEESSPVVSETSSPAKPKGSSSKESASTVKSYTKEELMDIDSKELVKICKEEFGINPDDFDGKNTNKKLRDLILDAQKNGSSKAAPAAESDEDTASGDGGEDSLVDQVAEVLEDFDAGKKNKKKAIATICGLVDDADEDAVTALVEKFEDDADADLDDMAKDIAEALVGKPEPKKSPKCPKKEDENLVEIDDLEVGDRVSVWWNDDNKDWFDGEVKSIKKGKVVIAYDDDTEEPLDPKVHTKIKKLAE